MAPGLVLVRHAMPEVVPGASSRLWRLSDFSREGCSLLANALPAKLGSSVISSGQPKVDEAAAVIALRRELLVETEARVAEVDQGGDWYEGDYRARAIAYLRRDDTPGWESRELVIRRFSDAVTERLDASTGG